MKKYRLTSVSKFALLYVFAGSLSLASEQVLANEANNAPSNDAMEQVTSVSELRDVQPTEWAYEALRSLVERYGCIVGYPDQTYRGNRALTRWEFAAGLNACMNTMERLIQENVAVLKEDVDTLKRLVQEFEAELAALGGRVDNLEGRVAFLEDHQFSTTTKLSGEVIFSVAGATGGEPDSQDPQITFNNRVRLNLTTSFSGKDMLITGLQAYNFNSNLGGGSSFGEELFPNDGSILGDSMTELSYEPQFAGYNPQNLSQNCGNNDVCLYKLLYLFPVSDNISLFVAPMAEVTDAFPTIIPFASEGQGAISRFGAINPVLRISGGTSGTGLASAGGVIFTPIPEIDIRALYGSVNAAIPENEGGLNTPLGAGLFNGSYVAATQLTLKPMDSLDIGLNYAHSYHQINILATGTSGASTGVLGDLPLDTAVTIDSVGASVTWRFSDIAHFTSYGSYFFVNEAGAGNASTQLLSWMAGFYFPDAIAEGNSAGLLFGQPLYRTDAGGGADLKPDNIGDRGLPWHLEAYYNLKVSDNISITPGAFVIFNPEGDEDNDTTGVFVLRTTFTF